MTVTIQQEDWQKVLAEVVGTFFFFFIGIGSVAWVQTGGVVYVALAHGLALAIAISALGHISGGHFNPAVTLGLMVARKISPMLAILYIIGQIVGGVLACLAVAFVLPPGTVQNATPHLAGGIGMLEAITLEAILTFFLVIAVFGTAVDPRATRIGGFGIGLTVFVDILVGGPVTGGVMNPARAITPAIIARDFQPDMLVYWVGPIVGGIIAALLYSMIFLPKGDEPIIKAPDATDKLVEPPLSEPGLVTDRS
jgi:MIP family channel proteins